MNKIVCTIAWLCIAAMAGAQTDTTVTNSPDTVKVGGFIIIKKNKSGTTDTLASGKHHYTIDINIGHDNDNDNDSTSSKDKHHNISTNYFIFDLGFAGLRDNTNYGSAEAASYLHTTNINEPAFTKNDLKLNRGKTSNVNIWLFMQKLNVTKHVVNLKYGLGLEMYNFRYDKNISYNKDPAYIFRDSVDFSKNKLYAAYATVPFMLNFNTTPERRRGFSFSAGVSAGYLIGSRTKQVSDERGKQKLHGDFDLSPWRLAYIAELGIGPVRLYGTYSFNTLHDRGLQQYPYAVGVRFSNW